MEIAVYENTCRKINQCDIFIYTVLWANYVFPISKRYTISLYKHRRRTNPLFSFIVKAEKAKYEHSHWNSYESRNIKTLRPGARGERLSPVYTQHPTQPLQENQSNQAIVSMYMRMYMLSYLACDKWPLYRCPECLWSFLLEGPSVFYEVTEANEELPHLPFQV